MGDWTRTMRESISDPTKEVVTPVKPEDVSSALSPALADSVPAGTPAAPSMNAVTRHLVDAIRTVDMIHRPGDDMLPRARATAIESLWGIINRTESPGQIVLAHREVAHTVVKAVGWLRENE
jgi:hypothetical protein